MMNIGVDKTKLNISKASRVYFKWVDREKESRFLFPMKYMGI